MHFYKKPQQTSVWIAAGVATFCFMLILGFIATGIVGKATLIQKNADSFAHMLQESNSGSVMNENTESPVMQPLKGLPPSFGFESAF